MRQLIADRFDHIQDLSSFFLLHSVVHTNILLAFLKNDYSHFLSMIPLPLALVNYFMTLVILYFAHIYKKAEYRISFYTQLLLLFII